VEYPSFHVQDITTEEIGMSDRARDPKAELTAARRGAR
jgi:hypothetical protein